MRSGQNAMLFGDILFEPRAGRCIIDSSWYVHVVIDDEEVNGLRCRSI